MAAASKYLLEPIRDRGAEFTLYRARPYGNPSPALPVASAADQPLPQNLGRLEHEYSLAAELEASADLLQWIRCHIVRHPLPPAKSGRPIEGRSSIDSVFIRFVLKPQPW